MSALEPSVMEVNQEMLRKQIMINQFCNQVGCTPELATEILQAARWQIEVGFSLFFQGHAVTSSNSTTSGGSHCHESSSTSSMESGNSSTASTNSFGARMSYVCVPTNTPATPPTLPDTLAAFAQMRASSPDQPRIVHLQES